MLYKRHKGEYKRSLMNDNWIEQKCRYCQYYSVCADINVLPPSNSYFNGLIEYSKRIQLNQICGLYQVYKGVIKSPKIILYLL